MIALIIIFIAVLLLLFLPITVKIAFSEQFDFNVKILGLTVFRMKDNGKKRTASEKIQNDEKEAKDKKSTDILNTVKSYFDFVIEFLKILYRYLKKRLKISELKFGISFGLGDAALTGIFSGGVYTVVNVFYAYILNNFNVKKHEVEIKPDFENEHIDIKFLLKVNINIIWLLCLLFNEREAIDKLFKILKKDGVNNGRTSN